MSKYVTARSGSVLPVRDSAAFPLHAGKGFVVTGAAGGIGRAVAELLLRQGARVVLADLREQEVIAAAAACGPAACGPAASGPAAWAVAMDAGRPEQVAAAIARAGEMLGTLHGLVNCAAIVRHADPLDIPWQDWTRQFEVNLFGAYEASRLVARHMIAAGTRGAIVSIASEAGKKGHMESLAYSASKAGLISMTRMLSEALAPHDINVNCVCPGGVATPMLREVAEAYARITAEPAEAIFGQMVSAQLRRHLQPGEVARVVSFLLGDDAMLVRGQAINADAGETPY